MTPVHEKNESFSEITTLAWEKENRPPSVHTVRVLHFINGEYYAGAERVQDLLAANLPQFGFEVGFACAKPGIFPDKRQYQQAPLYPLPMGSRLDLLWVRRLVRILQEGNYRILHAHTPRTVMTGEIAAAVAGLPLVYHVHSPTIRDSTRRLRNWMNTAVERISLVGAARLITVSDSLAAHMHRHGISRRRIVTVHNGVPVSLTRRDDTPPEGTWKLVTTALFRPRKGIEVLIDALAILRGQGRRVTLNVVGPFETPEYEREVKLRAADAGLKEIIQWRGFANDVAAELSRADLFVLPSLFGEGLPMVVLEAMAVGLPVVGTDVEGIPEVIRDEIDGAVVKAGNAPALADGIARIMDDTPESWATMHAGVIRRHEKFFSDRAMALGVANVYRDILGMEKITTAL